MHIVCDNPYPSFELLYLLIETKQNVNSKDKNGRTPLNRLLGVYHIDHKCLKYSIEMNSDLKDLSHITFFDTEYDSSDLEAILSILFSQTGTFFKKKGKKLPRFMSGIYSQYIEGKLWRPKRHTYFPIKFKNIIFSIFICLKVSSKNFTKQVFPKNLLHDIVQCCFGVCSEFL